MKWQPFYGFEHVELARNHTDEAHVGCGVLKNIRTPYLVKTVDEYERSNY